MPLAANINIASRDAYVSLGARFSSHPSRIPRDFDACMKYFGLGFCVREQRRIDTRVSCAPRPISFYTTNFTRHRFQSVNTKISRPDTNNANERRIFTDEYVLIRLA